MPTYIFYCIDCREQWHENQAIYLDQKDHRSNCQKCGEPCKSIAFGGTGFQLKGRNMNKLLEGFPDQTNRINAQADKDAKEMEKEYDAAQAEKFRKKE